MIRINFILVILFSLGLQASHEKCEDLIPGITNDFSIKPDVDSPWTSRTREFRDSTESDNLGFCSPLSELNEDLNSFVPIQTSLVSTKSFDWKASIKGLAKKETKPARQSRIKDIKKNFCQSGVILTTPDWQETPAHIAAQTPSANGILGYLLKKNPEQAVMKDGRGHTPARYTSDRIKLKYLHEAEARIKGEILPPPMDERPRKRLRSRQN